MTWTGEWKTTAKVGRPVVIDGQRVPKRITLTLEGRDGEPGRISPDFVAHFEVRDGVPECVELHLVAKADGRAIRTADLAMFNLEHLTEVVFLDHAQPVSTPGRGKLDDDELRKASRVLADRIQGPRPEPGDLLREVARAYLSDTFNAPLVAVENRLNCSRATAARRVKAARAAGWIPERGASPQELEAARHRLDSERPEPPANAMTIAEAQEWLGKRRKGQRRGEHQEEA